ncbi:aspartate transaminase [Burkholderia multivorans]|uniref:aspartate transaminase n=1 Tax=Burkholderia multivorans TaxID=87883 RepID=UPI0021BE6585|nr:aspartate transaminase [Burkholderia multivorans]MDR8762372.1 Aspartate aminotransferase [Burkholderia multivorans]MDR8766190.1 Aspartate aminotransferase [Burkholderia multivorans]MDR8770024.1 Aspartate aminotransferase [Burkholderia multivorans]MDR8789741.1 Aspartate aminotransferase [Burkholderia multivorans]MDR8794577.1 Aspartate aminotransferase [Burkholderia multivorans]
MSSSRIAARMQRIKTSPSSAAADRVAELRRQGRAIINLAIGEPDFPTPEHIRRAAADAVERGETRYTQTAGTIALRTAISEKLWRENDLQFDPKQIIVTCGAKHAIFNALAVTVEPEDEVLIPAPYWVSYPDMVIACEGKPVILHCAESDSFKVTPQQLESFITPRTRWLMLNSPSNPTGASYTAMELKALADVLMRHPQVLVLTDDIYEHIRFEGQGNPHIAAIEPALRDRTVVVNGMSKTYAMTGWRIGYAAGPADIIAAMDTLQSQSTSCASSVGQAAALAALNGDQGSVAEGAEIYKKRRDRAVSLLNAVPGLKCTAPAGAFYLFVNCAGVIGKRTRAGEVITSDSDFVLYLIESAGVVLVAGSAYGASPYFRMSIATGIEVIEEGCRNIETAVSELL